MQQTLATLIDAHACDDPADTATAVLAAIATLKEARAVLFDVVRDECRRQSRSVARAIEQSAPTDQPPSGTHNDGVGGGTTRTAFLASRFCTGDGWVTWGDATVQDHRDRITFQTALRNGISSDIDRHADAIERIERAGVSCLNDIELAAA